MVIIPHLFRQRTAAKKGGAPGASVPGQQCLALLKYDTKELQQDFLSVVAKEGYSMNIGKTLYEQRKRKHLRQEDVANYLHVSKSTLSNYENNIHEPDLETLVCLADFFDVSTDYLLGRTTMTDNFSVINHVLANNITLSNVMELTMQLTGEDLHYFLQTFQLLNQKLRHQREASMRKRNH